MKHLNKNVWQLNMFVIRHLQLKATATKQVNTVDIVLKTNDKTLSLERPRHPCVGGVDSWAVQSMVWHPQAWIRLHITWRTILLGVDSAFDVPNQMQPGTARSSACTTNVGQALLRQKSKMAIYDQGTTNRPREILSPLILIYSCKKGLFFLPCSYVKCVWMKGTTRSIIY